MYKGGDIKNFYYIVVINNFVNVCDGGFVVFGNGYVVGKIELFFIVGF